MHNSSTNPVALFLGSWIDTPWMKDLFLACPRAAIEMRVGVPDEIIMEIIERNSEFVKFKVSIPREPVATFDRHGRRIVDRRLKKCPIMNVSESQMINDPVQVLKDHSIRVPEDIEVLIDDDPTGYVHYITKIYI